MAIRGAVRFKPDMYRSTLEATVGELNAAATPPTGTVFMVAQLVAYDDTRVGAAGNPYVPGAAASRRLAMTWSLTPVLSPVAGPVVVSAPSGLIAGGY